MGGAAGGAAGVSGAGGGAGASPSVIWRQVACSVSRTECSGWVENDAVGIDGTDVNCPASNLVANSFIATVCFPTPLNSTFETQQADAQSGCDTWCSASGGFHGLYPLGTLATVAGSGVTCSSTAMNDTIAQAIAGQCATAVGQVAGASALVLCTLGGRACASMMTAADGTQYCASMPSLTQDQTACFDPSMTTGQDVCQHGFQFSPSTDGGVSTADEFAYWSLAQVTLESSPADCTAALSKL